jgi:RNA polymerase sigma-70 factor (ECF subfamily)
MDQTVNEQKFLEFYDKNITKIYRYIYFRVGSEELAKDLASEAFTKAWQYLKGGNYIGNLSAMTYQICRNLIADNFRNNSNLPISIDNVAETSLIETQPGFEEKAEKGLKIDQIMTCLRLIKEEYQEVIIWYFVDDFEIREIAQILGKSEGAVRTSLSRATKALKEALEA